MPSTGELKSPCSVCGDMVGIFTCRGCSDNLCLQHANEHRRSLGAQMNDIMVKHNGLKHTATGQTMEQIRHSLMEKIDHWEQQSIAKIRQVANDTREQVFITVQDRTDDFNGKVKKLSEELENAFQKQSFYETDLERWAENLKNLDTLIKQESIKVDEDERAAPFISRISLTDIQNGSYEQSSYDHHYQDNNHSPIEVYPKTQERGEYSSGEHLRRFTLEHYESNNLILFGIISKSAINFPNPYQNPTFYGWSYKNIVYLGDAIEHNYKGYESDFRTNDIFTLILDCNQKRISLTNERTNQIDYLDVDMTKCPFPWQLNVRLLNDSESANNY